MSYATRYFQMKRQAFDARISTPEATRARLAHYDAMAAAEADVKAKFPHVTNENFDAWEKFRNARIDFHTNKTRNES